LGHRRCRAHRCDLRPTARGPGAGLSARLERSGRGRASTRRCVEGSVACRLVSGRRAEVVSAGSPERGFPTVHGSVPVCGGMASAARRRVPRCDRGHVPVAAPGAGTAGGRTAHRSAGGTGAPCRGTNRGRVYRPPVDGGTGGRYRGTPGGRCGTGTACGGRRGAGVPVTDSGTAGDCHVPRFPGVSWRAAPSRK